MSEGRENEEVEVSKEDRRASSFAASQRPRSLTRSYLTQRDQYSLLNALRCLLTIDYELWILMDGPGEVKCGDVARRWAKARRAFRLGDVDLGVRSAAPNS